MAAAPCKECGVRPKLVGRHRCLICTTRHLPIGDQVAERDRRLAMVPERLRVARISEKSWPAGSRWCAGCQSFVPLIDVAKGSSRCRACQSAATHGAMVAKVYGLTSADYEALLVTQGGKCAICRARPVSKRLAVDHDHRTEAVRGLLCSRCNHDLLGSAWDSSSMALALWHYMNTPPTSGDWRAPELGLLAPAVAPSESLEARPVLGKPSGKRASQGASGAATVTDYRGALPDEWRDWPIAALNALWRDLAELLRQKDPAPF
jgi:hypothetical protein